MRRSRFICSSRSFWVSSVSCRRRILLGETFQGWVSAKLVSRGPRNSQHGKLGSQHQQVPVVSEELRLLLSRVSQRRNCSGKIESFVCFWTLEFFVPFLSFQLHHIPVVHLPGQEAHYLWKVKPFQNNAFFICFILRGCVLTPQSWPDGGQLNPSRFFSCFPVSSVCFSDWPIIL